MTSVLEGRVFARQQRFLALPVDLQDDTTQFQTYAAQNKTTLFQIHHAALVKSVYSVKGKDLVDAVIAWLQARDNAPSAPGAGAVAPVPAEAATKEISGAAPMTTTIPTVSAEVRERARQISEALVLTGFLTPYKDDEKHLSAAPPEYYVRDSDLLIPVAPDVTEIPTTSVWRVATDAIAACVLKRKAGVLGQFTHGKDVYVVFTAETAYLFESDLARAPLAEIPGATASVQFDSAHFAFGVRVTRESSANASEKKDTTELFNAGSKAAQDAFLNHWLNIGAMYREAYNVSVESVQSIYELKDRDMSGKEVSMDAYKGKVLLIVNVSSKCGLTPTNYPELAELDRKYRDEGLAILAFPCNQFANQEPGTHDEIMEFVKQYKCEFPFFEKHDVNGADARPVFTYLKAKLPGSFGNFVKWNFTKFLVDRNGQPYKRYAPKDLPFSFEHDIVDLLNTPAPAIESVSAVEGLVKDTASPEDHATTPSAPSATAAPIGAAPVGATHSAQKTASEPVSAHGAPAAF